MNSDTVSASENRANWIIPLWLKGIIAGLVVSILGILCRSLVIHQQVFWGVTVAKVVLASFSLLIILLPIAISFSFYSTSAFSLFCYWLLRFLREQICILAVLGLLYL